MIDNSKNTNTAYTSERQDMYYALEEDSWWFKHRADVFCHLAKQYMAPEKILCDIGGSNGYNSKRLQDSGFDVALIEPTKKACDNAKLRGVKRIYNLIFQDYSFSIGQFVCLDVIEHIENDYVFLCELRDKCESGAVGIIAVPAFQWLWSSEDEIDGHYRRYSKKQLKALLETAGFRVEQTNYLFWFLILPIYIRRHLMEKLGIKKKVYERSVEEEKEVNDNQFLSHKGLVGRTLNLLLNRELDTIISDIRGRGNTILFGSTIYAIVSRD